MFVSKWISSGSTEEKGERLRLLRLLVLLRDACECGLCLADPIAVADTMKFSRLTALYSLDRVSTRPFFFQYLKFLSAFSYILLALCLSYIYSTQPNAPYLKDEHSLTDLFPFRNRKLKVLQRHSSIYIQLPPTPNHSDHFSIEKMPTVTNVQVQESPSSSTSTVNKNTGFPEPFSSERNTTLTHPDADTSENASIEGEQISLSRAHSRKISFLSHRSKGSYSSGKIDPAEFQKMENGGELYVNIQYADGSKEMKGVKNLEKGD